MSEDKLKDAVAREMLTVMTLPGVPPAVLLDCELKKKYDSPARPWPYRDAAEALSVFQKIAAEGQKKYAGIRVSVEKETILRLEKNN